MPCQPNFFVISGGPGAGKTSIIDKLASRGFATVAEAGRDILRERAAIGGDAAHPGDARAFGDLMLARGIADYERMANAEEPVFFDRGIAELAGYFRLIGAPMPARVERAAETYRTNGRGRWRERIEPASSRRHGASRSAKCCGSATGSEQVSPRQT